MAKEEGGGSSFPSTGFVWVALVAAGAFFGQVVPWQGSRPNANDTKPYAYPAEQDVDARLWQDPLSAIARARDANRKSPGATRPRSERSVAACDDADEAGLHHPCHLKQAIADHRAELGTTVQVLGVMVQGGSYADSVEARRRARYAVVAALSRLAYSPEDSAHIGYVLPGPPQVRGSPARLPEFVGYEWFRSDKEGASVLVVWLDEYIFGVRTRARLASLTELIVPVPPRDEEGVAPLARWSIVGPAYGSTLESMLAATEADDPCARPGTADTDRAARTMRPQLAARACDMSFQAYGPTADTASLLGPSRLDPQSQWNERLRSLNLSVLRTVVDDRELARKLRAELVRRGVDPSTQCLDDQPAAAQHVVLVSEWDTFYGRSLPDLVGDALFGGCVNEQSNAQIHRVSYLRGLDGQLPATAAGGERETPSPSASGSDKKGSDRTQRAKEIERPEGQSQLDYLRRMTQRLVELERTNRRTGKGSIKAIGVLGSDVFDKLQVLQALRPEFPGVLFFTTDLDARMLHPREQEWARNLIVASSFGLALRDELQQDIPPFRDTYQTGVYLSTLVAVNNALRACVPGSGSPGCIEQPHIDGWFRDNARVFEVGRTGAFDFASPRPPAVDGDPGSSACDAADLLPCAYVHPLGTPRYASRGEAGLQGWTFAAVVAGSLLWAALRVGRRLQAARTREPVADPGSSPARRWLGRQNARSIAWWTASIVVIALIVAHAPALWRETVIPYLTQGDDGEPLSFAEGIGVWPSELLRVIAFVCGVLFVVVSWRRLGRNLVDISERLHFEPAFHELQAAMRADSARWPWSKRFARIFSFRLEDRDDGVQSAATGLSRDAQYFWKKYLYQGRGVARASRVVVFGVAFSIVAALLVHYFGEPNTPYRGEVAYRWDWWITRLTVAAMFASIFFVVDATVFCHQLVDALTREIAGNSGDRWHSSQRMWTQSTIDYYRRRFGIRGKHVDAFILIDFIALRTKVVAGLIYFPFIVISIIVFARSRFFDNWTMPVGLIVVLSAAVAIVVVCAVLLREAAERARSLATAVLGDERLRLKRRSGTSVAQVEAMIERVRAVRTGAFAPYTQQPVLKALLLTLGTLGGPALLDYLSLWSV